MVRLIAALIGAAALEAGGNALLRQGLLRQWWALIAGGVAALSLYSLLVNRSGLGLDFGRLMGSYIVAFFLFSQVLAAILFREVPSTQTLVGGGFILLGGLTILL